MMNFLKKYFFLAVICLATLGLVQPGPNALAFATSNSSVTAGVLVGPLSSPAAEGPHGRDDDFTNLSIDSGIPASNNGVTLSPSVKVFKNTVENIGPSDDTFIVTVPLIPDGFRVAISTDFGDHYADIESSNCSVSVPVAYRASKTFFVRVAAPAGLKTLSAYDTMIRAASTIDPTVTNGTIDRLYTGFIRVETRTRVVTEVRMIDAAFPTPGSEIEFLITYTNISSAGGNGSSLLTAYNIVISQNGTATPNNWGLTTEHIVGASDNQAGRIIGDREGSRWLTDIVTSLDAGQSGVFKFRRRIK